MKLNGYDWPNDFWGIKIGIGFLYLEDAEEMVGVYFPGLVEKFRERWRGMGVSWESLREWIKEEIDGVAE